MLVMLLCTSDLCIIFLADSFLNDAPDDLEANAGDPSPNLQLSETPPPNENYPAGLHNLIERIEHQYVNNRAFSSQGGENDNRIPNHQLFLQENDWNLWRIKCTAVRRFPSLIDSSPLNICLSPQRSITSYTS